MNEARVYNNRQCWHMFQAPTKKVCLESMKKKNYSRIHKFKTWLGIASITKKDI